MTAGSHLRGRAGKRASDEAAGFGGAWEEAVACAAPNVGSGQRSVSLPPQPVWDGAGVVIASFSPKSSPRPACGSKHATCDHVTTEQINGKTHCARCKAQLYL